MSCASGMVTTAIVPEGSGKPVEEVKVTEVPDPPVPSASASKNPSKSFVKEPVIVPPTLPTPNP